MSSFSGPILRTFVRKVPEMKLVRIIIPLVFLGLDVAGQVTITKSQNGIVSAETSVTREVAWQDPGSPGENRIWDFSSVDYSGRTSLYGVVADLDGFTGAADGSLMFSEEGYEYRYAEGERELNETGYLNAAKKMVAEYNDPIRRMVYPFSFGDSFTDTFAGTGWHNKTSRIDLTGIITYSADATGTLILPDRILRNVLRVRSDKRSVQTGVCGSTQVVVTRYSWYAPGYRYPVMMESSTDIIYGDREPLTTRVAWIGSPASGTNTGSSASAGVESDDHTTMVFPNPFCDQLNYSYFLRRPTTVKVELYDVSGRMNLQAEPMQLQTEGLHTGLLRSSVASLRPGVYYLRFTIGSDVAVSKVVKY